VTTVENRIFNHDGTLLAYRRLRRGDSTTAVVMIHGLASNSSRWSEFIEHSHLKPAWDLIAVDLRGHGNSVARCQQHHALWVVDLAALLHHEGYQQALVIGHSLGAQVAINFACRYPQVTKGLVLIEPVLPSALRAGFIRTEGTRWLLRALIPLVRLINRLGLYRRHLPIRDLYKLDRHMRALMTATPQIDIGHYYASPFDDLKYTATLSYLQDWYELIRPLPPLSRLATPLLVLLSRGERLSDGERLQRAFESLPNAEVKIFDANHWLLTEQPDETRSAIEAWCNVQ